VTDKLETVTPQKCERCRRLLDGGYSQRFEESGTLIETLCFDCSDKQHVQDYVATSILTTKVTMIATLDQLNLERGRKIRIEPDVLERVSKSMFHIEREFKIWESEVWFGGLRCIVRKARYRGHSLEFNGGDCLVWSCAGRTLFTLRSNDEKSQLTLICAEDSPEPTMGLQGICATEEQAISLLLSSRVALLNGGKFSRDNKVSI